MHKLDRSSVSPPACLASHDYRTKTWHDLDPACKRQVRELLLAVQGRPDIPSSENPSEFGLRCAYCEGPVRHDGHLEHFRRKNPLQVGGYPELTFVWENLFLSCGSNDHCGHHKDRKGSPYNPDELIKPDEHDPDDYLYFSASGAVGGRNTRPDMSDDDRRRASETIRVFNLDCAILKGARRRTLQVYRSRDPDLMQFLMEITEVDREIFLKTELEATRWEPYATTIKHFFEKLS